MSGIVWGPPLILLLGGTGIYLTVRMGAVQLLGFRHALGLISGKYDKPEDTGQISHFQALCTALSATIGTGNIAGVATAIFRGGPGAVFWMWMIALLGMAIKFTSCTLAVMFREVAPDGTVKGGPMYYIEKGLGRKMKPLAVFFALCTAVAALGIGNMVQAHSVADALSNLIRVGDSHVAAVKLVIGLILAVLAGLVIIGGIRRIARVASMLVPFMTVVYVGAALLIMLLNLDKIPRAFALIVRHAFTSTAATGGFEGAVVWATIRWGLARGVFSNESGLGSAPMAHAAARTNEPVREGLVAMVGPFVDTILICSMTALVIILTGAWTSGADGAPLTSNAFESALPGVGRFIVSIGLALFAYSTLISWFYYGERGVDYLIGRKALLPYKWVYLGAIVTGACVKLSIAWGIADILNALMAAPNLVALLGLAGVVAAAKKKYFAGPAPPPGPAG